MEAREDQADIEPPDDGSRFHVLVDFQSSFGPGRDLPAKVRDHRGMVWTVTRILDYWRHPNHRQHLRTQPGEIAAVRYLLEVDGPLPRQGGSGPQQVWLRSYGNGAGWYLRPDNPRQRPDNTGRERPRPDGDLRAFTACDSQVRRCLPAGSPHVADRSV